MSRLDHAIEDEEKKLKRAKSGTEESRDMEAGVHERIRMLKDERTKLMNIRSTIDGVLIELSKANKKNQQQMKRIKGAEAMVKTRAKDFESHKRRFHTADEKLFDKYAAFRKDFHNLDQELPDQILIQMVDTLSSILKDVIGVMNLAMTFNTKDMKPAIQESSQIVRELFYLDRAAGYLNQAYGHLAQSYGDISKVGQIVTQNAESRSQFMEIAKEDGYEEKESEIAARASKQIRFKISHAYRFLLTAVKDVDKHIASLQRDIDATTRAKDYTITQVKEAFKRTKAAEEAKSKQVLSEEKKAEKEAEAAETSAERARRQERKAGRVNV